VQALDSKRFIFSPDSTGLDPVAQTVARTVAQTVAQIVAQIVQVTS
jgi:hypothetical protein